MAPKPRFTRIWPFFMHSVVTVRRDISAYPNLASGYSLVVSISWQQLISMNEMPIPAEGVKYGYVKAPSTALNQYYIEASSISVFVHAALAHVSKLIFLGSFRSTPSIFFWYLESRRV